jgi:GTP:adenosylcobinamide-phosphate guanylyltransferase
VSMNSPEKPRLEVARKQLIARVLERDSATEDSQSGLAIAL